MKCWRERKREKWCERVFTLLFGKYDIRAHLKNCSWWFVSASSVCFPYSRIPSAPFRNRIRNCFLANWAQLKRWFSFTLMSFLDYLRFDLRAARIPSTWNREQLTEHRIASRTHCPWPSNNQWTLYKSSFYNKKRWKNVQRICDIGMCVLCIDHLCTTSKFTVSNLWHMHGHTH